MYVCITKGLIIYYEVNHLNHLIWSKIGLSPYQIFLTAGVVTL